MAKQLVQYTTLLLVILTFNPKGWAQNEKKHTQLLQTRVIAENYLREYNFAEALKNYLEIYNHDSTDSEVNFRIGMCYLNIGEYESSRKYLDKALADHSYSRSNIFYYSAKSYQLEHQFDLAISHYEKYLESLSSDDGDKEEKEIKREIEKCITAKRLIKNSNNKPINNLGVNINSQYPDYGAVLTSDEKTIIYTSERPTTTGGKKSKIDGTYHDDIYISYKMGNTWSLPTPIDELNTNHDDAVVSLSHDGKKLITYHYSLSGLGHFSGDLYISYLENGTWSNPKKLGHHINSKDRESSACFSNNDKTLYFVSDRPKGHGGLDIYKITKKENGKWGDPENLGPEINTPYDEESPYIHPDGKYLYFSSEGHENMGGFDIFKATLNDENKWENPTNLGSPVNTANDDVYFTVSANGKHIYFSDHRKENNYGHEDIYYSELDVLNSNILLLKGKIKNKKNVFLDAKVEIRDTKSKELITTTSSNNTDGNFLVIVSEGLNYNVTVSKKGYKSFSFKLDTKSLKEYNEQTKTIILKEE